MPQSPLIEVHDLSPLSVAVLSIFHNSIEDTTDCLGDISPVETCHPCKLDLILHFKSHSPSRVCAITRDLPVPGTSVSSVGHLYPYPELLKVIYARAAIPGISGSSVRFPYP